MNSTSVKWSTHFVLVGLLLTTMTLGSCSHSGKPGVSSSAPFFASLHGEQYSQWTALKGATVTLRTEGRPVLIAIVPPAQQLSSPGEGTDIQLYAPKSDIFNHWDIDVIRDSAVRVGQFGVGYAGMTYAFVQHIPLNF